MRLTTQLVLLTACLLGLPATAKTAEFTAGDNPPRAVSLRIVAYQKLIANKHASYQQQRLAQLQQLRERVQQSGMDGFSGARPEDTAWALAVIHDRQAMQEIQTSFQQGWQDLSDLEDLFQDASPQMPAASFFMQRDSFRRIPSERSTIRLAMTAQGPKIAAVTALNSAGMAIQSEVGCVGCHRK